MVEYPEFLTFSKDAATGTYAEVAISTALNSLAAIQSASRSMYARGGRGRVPVMVILGIDFQWCTSSTTPVVLTTAKYYRVHLTWKSKTDVMLHDDPDAITTVTCMPTGTLADLSQPNNTDQVFRLPLRNGILSVWPQLYVGCKQDSGGTLTLRGRIWYVLREASGGDVINAIVPQ